MRSIVKTKIVFITAIIIFSCLSMAVAQNWNTGTNWATSNNWRSATPTPQPTATPAPTPRPQTSTALKVDTTCVLTGTQLQPNSLSFTTLSKGTITATINKNILSSLSNFVVYVNSVKTTYTYTSNSNSFVLSISVK
jgi:hypothetical protein